MDRLPNFFWADRLTPINFYGYTSATRDRFYEVDTHTESEEKKRDIERFNDFKRKCLAMCVDMRREGDEPYWVKDVWDNKIVIECKTEDGGTLFVGSYDGRYSLGLSMYSRDRMEPRPYKQVEHPKEFSET